jgi:phage antirepressor YoqD-like protein
MNQLINTGVQTMTSREIAELTGSAHDSVLKTIRRLIAEGVVYANETYYIAQNKQEYPEFLLDFRNTMVIVSGYSAELRARIIDRWQALEVKVAASSFQIPTSLSGALRLAAEQAETIEAQTKLLEAAKPAVEFVQKYVECSGSKGFRQVCKLLNVNEHEFRAFLQARQIMYRLGSEWTPYQHHIDAGRFEIRAGVASANDHAFNSARFTPKGVQWVAGEFAKYKLQAELAA